MLAPRRVVDGVMAPVPDRAIECMRAFDLDNGDEIVIWRIPFRLVTEAL
jgi:hypothetical protein